MYFNKRILRKRRAWLWIFVFILLFTLFSAYGLIYFKEKSEPQEEVQLQTWSRFNEYKRLKMLFQGFAVRSIADIPCLDVDQMRIESLEIANYFGIAKERDTAGALQVQFGSQNVTFLDLDAIVDTLPQVDLILCWDYLCTLSDQEIRSALLQFKKSGANFLLMRHFPEVRVNEKKISHVFQPINWKLPPYSFSEPIIHIMGNGKYGTESLALWNVRDLP